MNVFWCSENDFFHNNAGNGKKLRAEKNCDGSQGFFEAKKRDQFEKQTLKKYFLAGSKKRYSPCVEFRLLFSKAAGFFSRRKYKFSSRLSHRFTVRTSLDRGKNTERVKNKGINIFSGRKVFFHNKNARNGNKIAS